MSHPAEMEMGGEAGAVAKAMKRFFLGALLTLTLLLGVAVLEPSLAHAAPAGTANGSSCVPEGSETGLADGVVRDGKCLDSAAAAKDNSAAAAAKETGAKIPSTVAKEPSTAGPIASVMNSIASMFAWLVTAAMITLNYAVYFTVIKMGEYVQNLTAIGVTWRILRDEYRLAVGLFATVARAVVGLVQLGRLLG